MIDRLSNGRASLLSGAAVCALIAGTTSAHAGGFALREQSVSSQGASFAGSAANNDLSAMFWNPAGAANKAGPGLNSESHYSLIVPRAEITVNSASHPLNPVLNGAINSPAFGNKSGDIGSIALLGASYYSYQFRDYDPNLFLGIAMNSPFGLKTDTDKKFDSYKGSVLGRESRLTTININPNLAYRISPTLTVGAGAQFQYGDARFAFATGLPNGADSRFDGSGFGVGATAGLMWQPTPTTTVGLGWRSQMTLNLDGAFINTPPAVQSALGPLTPVLAPLGMFSVGAQTTMELPDIVTLSLRQALSANMRMMGTVEWTNWSRLQELKLTSTSQGPALVPNPLTGGGLANPLAPGAVIGVIPTHWNDGWFFALGGEYDVNRQVTVRAGGAYEISPIDSPRKRLAGIPDNDRIWASLGATYKWSETTSFDFAYTHLFVKEGAIDRDSLSGFNIKGTVDASTDIISLSMKSRW